MKLDDIMEDPKESRSDILDLDDPDEEPEVLAADDKFSGAKPYSEK